MSMQYVTQLPLPCCQQMRGTPVNLEIHRREGSRQVRIMSQVHQAHDGVIDDPTHHQSSAPYAQRENDFDEQTEMAPVDQLATS